MSTVTTGQATPGPAASPTPRPPLGSGPIWIARDSAVMVRRYITHSLRQPELIVFSTIQPVMFVLLFRYVFGGAIQTGAAYVDYLMPGIFVQTTVFGAMLTGLGLAYDLQSGIIDRFRSLPMSRSAVLIGRTVTDALRNVFVIILMMLVGFAVGFRIHGGFLQTVGAVALIVLFGFAFQWISAVIGVAIRNPEAVQSAGFIWVFPITFLSSAFVPTGSIKPDWLQTVANDNPFTLAVNASRQLFMGPEAAQVQGLGTDPTSNVIVTVVWTLALLAVFIPLGVNRYRRA
ncbi:MAG TPA: ABC transporter permease [Candidatus Dormibacteraeota bacterium]|jgi:ABC-2 type transport system permease protein/oleandomycin transport system permease protein|nr:ABC transporter permease [Candidatus Dormibacteraeota bacterium]